MAGLFTKVMSAIFGTQQQRDMRRYTPLVEAANELEPEMKNRSDAELRALTDVYRQRIADGEELAELIPEAFAAVREASVRALGMRHFDVQLVGGMVLFEGKIAEMATGEGKTLVATLPAYLRALAGKGVHIVTPNDYLAKRDAAWMGPVHEFLGLTVGAIQSEMDPHGEDRMAAYRCDITYGTNNEFGFDYLRDNMAIHPDHLVQRGLYFCIVDEVDSILVDEARTPLIISGPAEEATEVYYAVDKAVRRLKKDVHFTVDEKDHAVILTEDGSERIQELLGINIFDEQNISLVHHVQQALRAHNLYKRDTEYIVGTPTMDEETRKRRGMDGKPEVVIVDEHTGRLMYGRRYSDGLHQALEAKEKLPIRRESQTLATITFQNYFRIYEVLSGMTGTAATEEQEFVEIYKLNIIVIPTNVPMIREDHADVVFRTEEEKYDALVEEIQEVHEEGRPILVGTISIENSERLSRRLQKLGMKHSVLNAKQHEREADVVITAGERGAITVATNMAGRGTDIKLGEGIAESGGLHIVGTERHESRRIDNQLRGRSGRQGDPGSSRFFLSLEDNLMRIFGGERIKNIAERMGMAEGEVLEHKMVSKAIASAQKRVEGHHFDIRKQIIKYDDVMNKQREVIYFMRNDLLRGENPMDDLWAMATAVIGHVVETYAPGRDQGDWDIDGIGGSIRNYFNLVPPEEMDVETWLGIDAEDTDAELDEKITAMIRSFFDAKVEAIGEEIAASLVSQLMLRIIDTKWKDHLRNMDHLKDGIHYQSYAQKDPLVEYQKRGFDMFEAMYWSTQCDIVSFWSRAQVTRESDGEPERPRIPMRGLKRRKQLTKAERSKMAKRRGAPRPEGASDEDAQNVQAADTGKKKVGRNDPCPCGSGKKYKKCCMQSDQATAAKSKEEDEA